MLFQPEQHFFILFLCQNYFTEISYCTNQLINSLQQPKAIILNFFILVHNHYCIKEAINRCSQLGQLSNSTGVILLGNKSIYLGLNGLISLTELTFSRIHKECFIAYRLDSLILTGNVASPVEGLNIGIHALFNGLIHCLCSKGSPINIVNINEYRVYHIITDISFG